MASIYALCDDRGNIRYIGKANNPASRLKGHLRETRRRTPLYDWLRSLERAPLMLILEEGCADWERAERDWIASGRNEGARLLNLAHGGDQPFCSPAVRSANGYAMNARLKADPRRARLRDAKRALSSALKRGEVMNVTRDKMMQAAAEFPHLFGEWRSIPYREENPDGSPVAGYARVNR